MAGEFWNNRYSGKDYAYGIHPNSYFQVSLDKLVPGKLLLPGEGEGRNAVYASGKGWEVTAIDQSSEGKRKALELSVVNNVRFQYTLMDVIDLERVDVQFNAIGLIFFHLPPENRKKVHRLLIDKLLPGGHIILEAFSKNQLGKPTGGPPVLEMLFDGPMLCEDFKDLEIIELAERNVILNEGQFHQGETSVMQMFATKKIK